MTKIPMKLLLVAGAAALVLAGATGPGLSRQATTRTICSAEYFTGQASSTPEIAKDKAVAFWALNVQTALGPAWATWANAKNARVKCAWKDRPANLMICAARAIPCQVTGILLETVPVDPDGLMHP